MFAALLKEARLMPLDPGTPNASARPALEALDLEAAFAPRPIADPMMAESCRSALWLYHDYLDVSHTISQKIETATGSYWHGIMHRREPDYANSKHWFRRVGDHPVFPALHQAAAELAAGFDPLPPAAAFLTTQAAWDPFAFIDLCEAAHRGRAAATDLCRRIQQREWELLFDYAYHRATG
jgi:hypothetical protein